MSGMERRGPQFSLSALLAAVAAVAIHLWLFRLGFFYGLVGLAVTKHLLIAYLCQVIGLDKGARSRPRPPIAAAPSPSTAPIDPSPAG